MWLLGLCTTKTICLSILMNGGLGKGEKQGKKQ